MDGLREALALRDVGAAVSALFELSPGSGGVPAVRAGYKRESELWDFKTGLPNEGRSVHPRRGAPDAPAHPWPTAWA